MKTLFKALAEFQQEIKPIHKGTKGYGYTYADLPTIFEAINPLLKKHGLGFTQELDTDSLVTTIFHVESGEFRASRFKIPQEVNLKGMNEFQVMGSAITYYRRYMLSSALGLVTDVDNDASGKPEPTKKAKPFLNIDTKEWSSAVEYLKKGNPITDIEKKYKISDTAREMLLENAM
jgi:hypothetical protein